MAYRRLHTILLVLLGGVLVVGSGEVRAQGSPSSASEQESQQAQERQGAGFFGGIVQGINVGVGLSAYQGDVSRNPSNNLIKYIGTADLQLRVGGDHRFGVYEQYGLGADLVYARVDGRTSGDLSFQTNMVSLDLYGDYELPYIQQRPFRVFLSVGPTLTVGSSFEGYDAVPNTQTKGTRVFGSATLGVTIFDRLKIGMRAPTTDYFDGYLGFGGTDGLPDFLAFVTLNYRFDLSD